MKEMAASCQPTLLSTLLGTPKEKRIQSSHTEENYRFGDVRDPIRKICGDEVGDKCPPIWGLNDEGELRGTWRELGTPGLWYMMGMRLFVFSSVH